MHTPYTPHIPHTPHTTHTTRPHTHTLIYTEGGIESLTAEDLGRSGW